MGKITQKENLKGTSAYLNDVKIRGAMEERHDSNLKRLDEAARKYNLTFKDNKSTTRSRIMRLLGFEISDRIVRPDLEWLQPLGILLETSTHCGTVCLLLIVGLTLFWENPPRTVVFLTLPLPLSLPLMTNLYPSLWRPMFSTLLSLPLIEWTTCCIYSEFSIQWATSLSDWERTPCYCPIDQVALLSYWSYIYHYHRSEIDFHHVQSYSQQQNKNDIQR